MKSDDKSTKEEEKNEVVKLTIENFIPWVESKFNDKYEPCLESLKDRFVGIFTLFKLILQKIIEIDSILAEDTSDHNVWVAYKPLLDNMIRLLDIMMKDFPTCLDLEFVEYFFLSVQERIQIFLAHFHQIFHITHSDPNINNKISKCTQAIDNAIGLIPEFQRIWRYYLLDCAGLFRSRRGQLRQIVLSKCNRCQIYRSVPPRACQLTSHGPKLVSNLLATEHDLSGVFETTDAMK